MLSNHLIAAILGLVEGLTEFIPVSSTGHLILVAHALGFTGDKASFFEVFIQLGAVLAVVLLYSRFFFNLFRFDKLSAGEEAFRGWDGLYKLGLGCLPAFVAGFLFHSYVKNHLFNPQTVAIGLAMGGLVLLLIERRSLRPKRTRISEITARDCILIGLFQCLALWPGVSRSGATIIGALIIGFDRRLAAEFSFLLAVPVLAAAASFDLFQNYHLLVAEDYGMLLTGLAVSFLTAIAAIRFFITYLQNHSFNVFGYYRLALAALVLVLWRG